MRRKDVLIIAAVLVVITFGAVFAIYYSVNGGNIFSKVKEEIVELAENKGEYHSNGWETAIVDKVKYDIPIPVGFSYVEGDKEKGLIIENNETAEKYMWIPYQEVLEVEGYEEIILNEDLEDNSSASIQSIQKYGGFFVAIDDRSDEERFEEYLKENTEDFETYYELKNLGYEEYKKVYKETTGEEFNLNSFENIVVDDSTQLNNYTKTNIAETHTSTKDELISIISYNNKIGNKLKLDNLKTLSLSISTDEKKYPVSINGTREMLSDYKKRIENAIEYITENTDYSEKKVKNKLGDDYEDLLEFEVIRIPRDYDKVQELFSNISDVLIEEFDLNSKQEKEVTEILEEQENVMEIDESVCEKYEDKNGEIVYIPNGFDYESGTVKTGLKIKNTDNLSFIWIPVENINEVKDEFVNNAKQANLNDSIIEAYEEYEDNTEDKEYKNLVDSIEMYGGFYVSEAELGYDKNVNVINKYRDMIETGGEGTGYDYVSNGDYYRNVTGGNIEKDSEGNLTKLGEKQSNFKLTYENAVNVCKDLFADSETVVSHLTYGIEYDAVVNYLINTGVLNITEAFKDSSKIGKYKGTETIKSAWETELYLNGIYGLAGNLEEITQEKDGEDIILRGGSWYTSGTTALASKISLEKNEIDKGQDSEGNDILLGSVGFRACLYIKTEYEKNEDLENKKENAKEELRKYIEETSVKVGEVNYFNNKYNGGAEEYENDVLNDIVKYIDERIDAETSSTSFDKIIQYGKDEVNKLVNNIAAILSYPEGVEEYTYGETSDECWNIKVKSVEEMQNLSSWDNGVLTNKNKETTSYVEIRLKAEKDIETVRNTYRDAKIVEYIDDYPTATDKDYTNIIKTRAKEEMRYTNDLGNLESIAIKYQGIIEVANSFDSTEPNTWDYYESWKNDYGSLKEKYLNKIANEAKTKEEAEAIAKEGMEKINAKATEVIAKKKEEEAKAADAAAKEAAEKEPSEKET